jgi:methylated-DNA-[protein]-cysteine S-methyltransferase
MSTRIEERVIGTGHAGEAGVEKDRSPSHLRPDEWPIAYLDTVESPAGPLTFAVDGDGALLRVSFLDGRYARTVEEELADEGFQLARDPGRTAETRRQLLDYAAGARQSFDVPLVLRGTEWQVAVWRALTRIPYGETRSYAQLATMAGRPGAARAAGRANATNRLPIVVPCHRVIGSDGSLTGFAGGTHLKSRLLEHEARSLAGER